jgi:hypothetical protein
MRKSSSIPDPKITIEIKKESGEVILEESFSTELAGQNHFDHLESIRFPMTYKGLTLNLSDHFTGGNIGSVVLVVTNYKGDRFERRELFRNP